MNVKVINLNNTSDTHLLKGIFHQGMVSELKKTIINQDTSWHLLYLGVVIRYAYTRFGTFIIYLVKVTLLIHKENMTKTNLKHVIIRYFMLLCREHGLVPLITTQLLLLLSILWTLYFTRKIPKSEHEWTGTW